MEENGRFWLTAAVILVNWPHVKHEHCHRPADVRGHHK